MVFFPGIFMARFDPTFSTKWKTGELGGADFGLLEVTWSQEVTESGELQKYGDWMLDSSNIENIMEISWRFHGDFMEPMWNMMKPNGEWWNMVNQSGVNMAARILVGIGSKLMLF